MYLDIASKTGTLNLDESGLCEQQTRPTLNPLPSYQRTPLNKPPHPPFSWEGPYRGPPAQLLQRFPEAKRDLVGAGSLWAPFSVDYKEALSLPLTS